MALEFEQTGDAEASTLPCRGMRLDRPGSVPLVIKYQNDLEPLVALGFEASADFGTLSTGTIHVSDLANLAAHPNLVLAEFAAPDGLALDNSIPEIRGDSLRSRDPSTGAWSGLTGRNVIVGIIDSGINVTHRAFRNPDGSSRILFLWDQSLTEVAGEGLCHRNMWMCGGRLSSLCGCL